MIWIAERINNHCNTNKYFGQRVKDVMEPCSCDCILSITFHGSVLSGVSWHPHGRGNERLFSFISFRYATPTYFVLLTALTGCHQFHAGSSIVLPCTLRGKEQLQLRCREELHLASHPFCSGSRRRPDAVETLIQKGVLDQHHR